MAVNVGAHIENDAGDWWAVLDLGPEEVQVVSHATESVDVDRECLAALVVALLQRCDPEDVRDAAEAAGFDLKALAGVAA